MNSLSFLFLIFNSINLFYLKELDYKIIFEYLYSDEKDSFELELYNRPKINSLDFGDDIFYSGPIEKIENYPVSKLINFTKEDFYKNNKKEEREKQKTKEEMKETKQNINQKNKKQIKEISDDKGKNNYQSENEKESQNEYDIFDKIFFEEPLIRKIFDNDYNKFLKFIEEQYLRNNIQNQKQINKQDNKNYQNQKPYIQIIQRNNNNDYPIIRIIKYPNNDRYKTTKYENNFNYRNQNYDPFSFDDFFDNFGFGMDNFFRSMESELNNMYRIRLLSEKENPEETIKSKQKIFSKDNHDLIYISNKLYFDYIKYLPKSTIILTQKQFAKDLKNYQDYYIFTIKDGISFSGALSKSQNTYYKVKIGQNFDNTNLILISISITVFICLLGSIIYSYLLKRQDESDILPVQILINKFPQYLCLLNLLMYFSFVSSYNETDGYFIIVKYISLFLYSLFKSIFICILMLLLNGWMTLTFIEWANKINRVIPIIFYEIFSSIAFEIIGFYELVPYNKLQLYYFRDIFENLVIISLSLISINRFYIPLNKKCKYLSIINSDFCIAYNLKKNKMKTLVIFGIIYSIISIYVDFIEFDYINKYLQNNTLHVLREIMYISVFNLIFMSLFLPMKLPHLFVEETDLLSREYLIGDLSEKNILDINDKEIKNIKKDLEKNEDVQIILVNPFFGKREKETFDDFEELHMGNPSVI